MKTPLLLLLAAALPLSAQSNGIQEPSEFLTLPGGGKIIRWYGKSGNTYFLQSSSQSEPLRKWIWAPIIEQGNDGWISHEVVGDADKGFFRLFRVEQLPALGLTVGTDDYDSDGLSNLAEIESLPQTHPYRWDTDGDTLPDGWEHDHGLDPTDPTGNNGAGGDPDHDGLTNYEEYQHQTDPASNDSDGDGITDGGEVDQNTNPNDPTSKPEVEWVVVTGDFEKDITKTRSRIVTIPAGQTRLVVVAVASDEFPYYTSGEGTDDEGNPYAFNDTLSWNVSSSGGQPINGGIDVNSRHQQWLQAQQDEISILGNLPAYIEKTETYTAPPDADMAVTVTLSATNVHDDTRPSSVMVGLLPMAVTVDADRDGYIDFGGDLTKSDKPYEFWVNRDRDIGLTADEDDWEEDDVEGNETPETEDIFEPGLHWLRDLEDITRVWIDMRGLRQIINTHDASIKLRVRMEVIESYPEVTLFQPVEADGGREYLKSESVGWSQLADDFGIELCTAVATPLGVEVPRRAWENPSSDGVIHLLFEGKYTGKGKLIFEFRKGSEVLVSLPPVYLNLKTAENMYETWTVGDASYAGVDYGVWPDVTATQTTGQNLPAPQTVEEKDYILFVHGWNMPPWEKEAYASTMFKRMWHQGYKGRFGAFRWPTFYGFEGSFLDITQDADHFNASELRAWNSASRLKTLIENRASVFGSNKIRLYGHSMGNVVCGEALRQSGSTGAPVHSYIAAQAAISSHTYDNTTLVRKSDYSLEMPNVYGYYWQYGASDWPPQWEIDGRPSYMDSQYLPGNVTYINHYNFDDYALNGTRWPLNQDLKPGLNYHYTFQGLVGGYSDYRFIRGPRYNQTILNFPADRYEIFSNAADSVANALGKVGTTGGKFSESLNVAPLLVYDTHPEAHKYHSGQFRSTIQKRWNYWKTALKNIKTATPD